jgi:hypothetical protein
MEGIGAIPRAEGKKAATRNGNYQENVTLPLSREHDKDAIADVEFMNVDLDLDDNAAANGVLSAVEKVHTIHST